MKNEIAVNEPIKQYIPGSTERTSLKSKLKEMESEVKRVVELMGGKLSSLSNQFVQDYTPLTNELKYLS